MAQYLVTTLSREISNDDTAADRLGLTSDEKAFYDALAGCPPDLQNAAVKTVLAQAELLCADWAG